MPRDGRRVNQVLADAGPDVRAVFVSIDPDRDGPTEMASYLRYLPDAYTGLSGTPEAIAPNAAAWGVKYAKIDEGTDDGYGMAHTADVFLVDAAGNLRARFPFGTEAGPITAEVTGLLAETAAAPPAVAPPPAATPAALAGGSGRATTCACSWSRAASGPAPRRRSSSPSPSPTARRSTGRRRSSPGSSARTSPPRHPT